MKRLLAPILVVLASSVAPSPKPTPPSAHAPKGYIGLCETAAGVQADQADLPHRVVKRDGTSLPCTMDYCPQRLNFTIDRGIVTSVTHG